jgi:hypothetical protein
MPFGGLLPAHDNCSSMTFLFVAVLHAWAIRQTSGIFPILVVIAGSETSYRARHECIFHVEIWPNIANLQIWDEAAALHASTSDSAIKVNWAHLLLSLNRVELDRE